MSAGGLADVSGRVGREGRDPRLLDSPSFRKSERPLRFQNGGKC